MPAEYQDPGSVNASLEEIEALRRKIQLLEQENANLRNQATDKSQQAEQAQAEVKDVQDKAKQAQAAAGPGQPSPVEPDAAAILEQARQSAISPAGFPGVGAVPRDLPPSAPALPAQDPTAGMTEKERKAWEIMNPKGGLFGRPRTQPVTHNIGYQDTLANAAKTLVNMSGEYLQAEPSPPPSAAPPPPTPAAKPEERAVTDKQLRRGALGPQSPEEAASLESIGATGPEEEQAFLRALLESNAPYPTAASSGGMPSAPQGMEEQLAYLKALGQGQELTEGMYEQEKGAKTAKQRYIDLKVEADMLRKEKRRLEHEEAVLETRTNKFNPSMRESSLRKNPEQYLQDLGALAETKERLAELAGAAEPSKRGLLDAQEELGRATSRLSSLRSDPVLKSFESPPERVDYAPRRAYAPRQGGVPHRDYAPKFAQRYLDEVYRPEREAKQQFLAAEDSAREDLGAEKELAKLYREIDRKESQLDREIEKKEPNKKTKERLEKEIEKLNAQADGFGGGSEEVGVQARQSKADKSIARLLKAGVNKDELNARIKAYMRTGLSYEGAVTKVRRQLGHGGDLL